MPYMPISWGGLRVISIYGSPMECLGLNSGDHEFDGGVVHSSTKHFLHASAFDGHFHLRGGWVPGPTRFGGGV